MRDLDSVTNGRLKAALRRVAMAQFLCDSGDPQLLTLAADRIGVRRSKVSVAKGKAGR